MHTHTHTWWVQADKTGRWRGLDTDIHLIAKNVDPTFLGEGAQARLELTAHCATTGIEAACAHAHISAPLCATATAQTRGT